MTRDDVSVRVSLRAGKAPVLGADWYIEPFSDDPLDLAIAEFVQFSLFEGTTTPWVKTLEQVLKMFEYGSSVFETVWEMREWSPAKANSAANRKQYTMLKKLAARPSSTIQKFNYDDNGGPLSVDHTAVDGNGNVTTVTIPIEKLVIFTFDQDGGNLDGNSILRSAYRNWYYKDHLYKIDAIQKERHGIGIPDIELQPGFSDADKKTAHELGANLRTNERAYIVRTPHLKVGFAEVKGNLVDALQSAEHHDTMIMKNIMVHFLNLGTGTTGGGGRATGATAMDMFLKSMRHIGFSICDCINLYLVPNLVAYNFPTDHFPKLRVRNIGETKDMQMWAAAMRNLIDVNAILVDDMTEQWIRQQMDMPKRVTPFPPPIQPQKTQEIITERAQPQAGQGSGTDTGTAAATPNVPTSSSSKNGGAGNVGKSPSSGAV